MATRELKLKITGMTCGKCERLIKEGITDEVAGVASVEVDRPASEATVTVNSGFDDATAKPKILSIVNSLVNGKFQAEFVNNQGA